MEILLVIVCFILPVPILFICHRYKALNSAGPVVVAYVVGIIAGNTGLLNNPLKQVVEQVSMVSVTLALPLILFSTNLKKWAKLAPKAFLSMIIGVVSVVIIIFAGYFVFRDKIQDTWKIAGLLVGVYTGGTPNLAAIKTGLQVNNETYIMVHTYDMLVSAVYLLFLMTVGKSLFSLILPAFKTENIIKEDDVELQGSELFWGLHKRKYFRGLALALAASLGVVAVSVLAGNYMPEKARMAIIILLITSLGIAFSFIPRIKKTKKTYELGMYFIIVFCLSVASLADIGKLAAISPFVFIYLASAVFLSLILHVLFSRLFKIDSDTVIVTSTALICSPPFVPVVAGALRNKEVVLSGIATGIIGFALGNYLGIGVAVMLQ